MGNGECGHATHRDTHQSLRQPRRNAFPVVAPAPQGGRLRAFCSLTFDDTFVIRDVKLIDGNDGLFLAMPSRKLTDHCPAAATKTTCAPGSATTAAAASTRTATSVTATATATATAA